MSGSGAVGGSGGARARRDRHRAGAPGGPGRGARRVCGAARITKGAMGRNLVLARFGFRSPTDSDWHLRPVVSCKVTDSVKATLGANLMDGDDAWTQFGQFADNGNVYFRLRYSF